MLRTLVPFKTPFQSDPTKLGHPPTTSQHVRQGSRFLGFLFIQTMFKVLTFFCRRSCSMMMLFLLMKDGACWAATSILCCKVTPSMCLVIISHPTPRQSYHVISHHGTPQHKILHSSTNGNCTTKHCATSLHPRSHRIHTTQHLK